MENKINIAELLKECPEGMELDCVMFDKVNCIPFEGNELLLGTTDDCSEYYKTWEELL